MFVFLLAVLTILVLYYLLGNKNQNYWEKKGVKHEKPIPFFQRLIKTLFIRKSVTKASMERYWMFPEERFVGAFRGSFAILIIRDPELIKRILVSDFHHFYLRGFTSRLKVIEPLMKNLFFADGDTWKLLRQRVTPAFTTGKLKAMFPLIVDRAEQLQKLAEVAADTGKTTDVRELMARYTTDFIGACGFGIDSNSLNDDESNFRKLGAKIFEVNYWAIFTIILKEFFPNTFKNWKYTPQVVEDEIFELVTAILKQRNYTPSGRNDFIDLLLELKNKGSIIGDSIEHINPDGTPKQAQLELDDLLMTAQVFVFFAAGFETSSSATSFTLHQLAYHPEEQKKIQKEIDTVLSKYNNKFCYDAIKEMSYLEMAFKEGLRLFPALGYLSRECARKYTIPDTNITIDEGVKIIIPVQAIHLDEKYYDNPEQFKPERFSQEEIQKRNKYVYFPFGAGPRACIGEFIFCLHI